MPLFHFNFHDGESRPDETGTELRDVDTARSAAIGRLADRLQESPEMLRADADWRLDVTDRTGLILFTLMVLAIEAPARRH